MKIFLDDGRNHVLTKRMLPYWAKEGHSLTKTTENSDIHLTYVKFDHSSKLPKVVRLDGVYYDQATDYNQRNHRINEATKQANGIIYQSQFSKRYSEKYLTNTDKFSTIIYNGVEPNWCGAHEETFTFNIIAVASWRRWKRLKEIIKVFKLFSLNVPTAYLHIIGEHDYFEEHSKIKYYGKLSHTKMTELFCCADVSLYLAKRDWCPNALIETIGAGVPVITTDASGGAAEMLAFTDNCIVCPGELDEDEQLYQYTETYNDLSKKMRQTLCEALQKIYKEKPRVKLPEQLTIEYVSKQYIKFLSSVKTRS